LIAEKAAETAKRWNVPRVYQDVKQMLEEVDPQVVYVVMGPQFVFEPASYLLQKGKHVFIEKPPGVNLHQIKVLAHLAKQNRCLIDGGFSAALCRR
jgi:predicted dehydrogenase